MVVPLDSTQVVVELLTPSGKLTQVYAGELDRGTHSIPLSSEESGDHTVYVYLDGNLLEDMTLTFK